MQELSGQRLVFFVVGRAGWGKSSTVNSLIGEEKCKVDDDEVATTEVTEFDFDMNGVKAKIFDTPGLCDGSGNDQKYIKEISQKIKNPDLMLYVNRLDETRITGNDQRGIKIISDALGWEIWENAVIVFTFSNNVSPSEYNTKLAKRTDLIRKAIADCIQNPDLASQIPVVAIDNKNSIRPDGKEWLAEFFTVVADRVSLYGLVAYLSMLTLTITKRTQLSKQQKEIIRKKFVSAVFSNAASAMGIGVVIAGLTNAPIILGFSSAGILGTLVGAWLSKDD
ncbi:50S ribosome-binding GTPase [Trichocoleus sp. DQ-A3]|uniref:GTPase n=1 Tax=Cyanophyceae TaxID=3028117 RepID=UPI0016834A2E|nr:50S ribosome-binding GTPase [Coleofasciculus sp. FACHB-125]